MTNKIKESELKDAGPNHWVKNHADYLYSYVCTRVEDNELAKDLVQETFLAALEGWEKFDSRSSEKTWLTAILKNKIYDVYRKKANSIEKQTITINDSDTDEFFEESGHWKEGRYPESFGIEDAPLENKEFDGILTTCMSKLPILWKSVFTMKHVDEETSETICCQLNITSSNFWVICHRAKVSMRECLQKNWI
ncbi:sigma-70 family RNA polymerase sigma factor [Flavobacterium plurextorum]|uniref:sigma-70 family RNA polymerase sigma factor n=1 Tax=Flavobacterium TaxID=237 RepID=UPI00214D4D86|nr:MULTISPECIES: sigma-70 family RNA polymerase sigma factor [Flavobacterium]UUW08746.1 sigma-70 family RNA polymerase sigma factor [Flavobacterium plurextorum]